MYTPLPDLPDYANDDKQFSVPYINPRPSIGQGDSIKNVDSPRITLIHIMGLFVAAALIGMSAFIVFQRGRISPYVPSSLQALYTQTSPTPTQSPQPTNQTSVMDSPEGEKTLTLDKEMFQERTSHTIFVSTKSDGQRVQIIKEAPVFGPPGVSGDSKSPVSALSATEEAALDAPSKPEDQIPKFQNLEIPFNTWSPENGYFFLKDRTHSGSDYFVFQSSSAPFASGERALSIQSLFKEKVEGYIIEDVTGWAGPGLIVVNTKAVEGDGKVSFWFEVYSQSFIQLGTYFK